jgi:hypothetical protein
MPGCGKSGDIETYFLYLLIGKNEPVMLYL